MACRPTVPPHNDKEIPVRKALPAVALTAAVLGVAASPALAQSGALNPDVTQATIQKTICVSGFSERIRPPSSFTSALKVRQIAAMHLPGPASAYEEDHIIPLSLGGAPRNPANLQPVPLAKARTQDVQETRLHRDVCAGRISLAAAQAEILRLKTGKTAIPTPTASKGAVPPVSKGKESSVSTPMPTASKGMESSLSKGTAVPAPKGPVNAGAGGSSRLTTIELAIGGALTVVAVSGGITAWVRRRSASGRG